MNQLIKITEEGDDTVWHLVDPWADYVDKVLCTGQVFGIGESAVEYELKTVSRGVPCDKCREVVKKYKSVRV